MSPNKRPTLPVDIYCRVSRVAGRDVEADGGTASEQEKRCRAQVEADGLKAGRVFIDLDQSGGKTSRPEFDKAKARIESGESGGLCVINLSRFGRNRRVDEDILALEEMGGTVISIEDKLDTSTPSGRFALTILAAVNTLYLENVTEAWGRTHVNHIARGVPTGRPPAGYSKTAAGTLEPNEFAPVIKEGFEMRANGGTVTMVRDLLIERGVPTSGGGRWQERTTARLLQNPTYTGQVRFGDLVEKSTHEAIIDPALWRRVQKTFGKGAPRGSRGEKALLSEGLLRCADCGEPMSLSSNKRGDSRYYFYSCRSETHAPRPTIGQRIADQYIIDQALAKAGTMRGKKPATDDPAYAAAEADYHEAVAEVAEVEAMIGTKLPDDSKQVLAVRAAEDALDAARTSGAMIDWVIPYVEDIAAIMEATPKAETEVELPGVGMVTLKAITSTHSNFLQLPGNKKRELLAGLIESATVKVAGKGAQVPVEERIGIKWKAVA